MQTFSCHLSVAVQMNKDDIIVLPDNTCTLYSKFCLVTTQFLGDAAIIQTAFVYVWACIKTIVILAILY